MDREQILQVILELAQSQGFWGRLYDHLAKLKKYQPDSYEDYMTMLESKKFGDAVDVVLFFET